MGDGFNVAMPCANCGKLAEFWVAGDVIPASRAQANGTLTVYCGPCSRLIKTGDIDGVGSA